MRLFLALLMLTLLPLQFSAAADADCCGHGAAFEQSPTNHHQPIHQPVISGADDTGPDVLGFDLDCGTCHANCAAAVMATTETVVDPAGIGRGAHLVELVLPPWHEQPYRPQWSAPQGSGMNVFA